MNNLDAIQRLQNAKREVELVVDELVRDEKDKQPAAPVTSYGVTGLAFPFVLPPPPAFEFREGYGVEGTAKAPKPSRKPKKNAAPKRKAKRQAKKSRRGKR